MDNFVPYSYIIINTWRSGQAIVGGESHVENESRIVGVDGGVVRSIIYHRLRAETWMPHCARNDFSHLFIHNFVAFGRQMKTVAAGGKGIKEWMGEVRR